MSQAMISHPTLAQELEAFKGTPEYELALQVDYWARISYPRCCKGPGEFNTEFPPTYTCWYILSSMSVMHLTIDFATPSIHIKINDGVASRWHVDISDSMHGPCHGKNDFVLILSQDILFQGTLIGCLEKAFEKVQKLVEKFYSKQFLDDKLRPY